MGKWDFLDGALVQASEITEGLKQDAFAPDKLFNELMSIDAFKELNAYRRSEKNIRDCEPFEQLNQKYIALQRQYGNSYHELYKDVEAYARRCEYARGGEGFHRGFYSPSVMDLVVGGLNRGSLYKRLPKNNKHSYEYVFDAQDNLICVHEYGNLGGEHRLAYAELFVREQDTILSLIFDPVHASLQFISECQYTGNRLMRYAFVHCDLWMGGKGCNEINVETHGYAGGLMQAVCWYRYSPSIQLLDQYKYTFARDEEGYLSTYTEEQLGGFRPHTTFDEILSSYKVRVRRK